MKLTKKGIATKAAMLFCKLVPPAKPEDNLNSIGKPSKKKAMILVLVLWMVILLGGFAVSLSWDVTVNSKLTLAQREQQIAYNLARSGVAMAMTHLANDLLIEEKENSGQPYDAFSDIWAQPPEDKELEKGGVKLGKGTYSYEITDEGGKININKASSQLLEALLAFYGYDEIERKDVANAIIDWRDADSIVSGDDSATGLTENEFYSELSGQKLTRDMTTDDLNYRCPNEPFLTIEELLDVNGITQDVFFGTDPEASSRSQLAKRNRAATGSQSSSGGKRRSLNQNTPPMRDLITVYGEGDINMNTANQDVLTILLYAANNLSDMGSASATAKSIVDFRGDGKKKKNLKPDDALKSAEDLAKISGLNAEEIALLSNLSNLGVNIVFKSSIYSILGTGLVYKEKRANQTEKSVKAVVFKKLDVYNPDDARLATNKSSRASVKKRSSSSKEDDGMIRVPAIRVLQWIE